ncbi:unnamed protein product [Candidula unifasciata]|uniref:G-protein coupled receptors family 1 profile domain-containing protein n=1 Tax=Candidula unifasciata TaxID=100452 RepID=A0A8S3ZU64_9EUPU|nr:unnamed protein product [Candidula unifasciata]
MEQTVLILAILVERVAMYGISVFGIIGNSINIVVLNRHGFQDSTNIILVSLSVSDLCFCILLPVTRLGSMISHFDEVLATSAHTFVTVFFFMPKFVFLGTSFWYVALIAVERYTAVFFPFHVSIIFTKTLIKCLVTAIFLASVLTISPSFFALNYKFVYNVNYNQTTAVIVYTNFYRKHHSIIDFYVWVGLTNIFCSISAIVVLYCCVAIVYRLSQASSRRLKMTSNTTGYDIKVVKMLVTVCIIYLCVQIPLIVMYSYFRPDFMFRTPVHQLFNDICDILCLVNASANYIVYVTMSAKFARNLPGVDGMLSAKVDQIDSWIIQAGYAHSRTYSAEPASELK